MNFENTKLTKWQKHSTINEIIHHKRNYSIKSRTRHSEHPDFTSVYMAFVRSGIIQEKNIIIFYICDEYQIKYHEETDFTSLVI